MAVHSSAIVISLLVAGVVACSGTPSDPVGQTSSADSANNVEALYTISYAPNSFVIGNAYAGWTDELRGDSVFAKGPGNASGVNYQCGFLYGENFDHCGWVDRTVVSGGADSFACGTECPGDYDTTLFRSTYTDGTINAGVSDGQETHMHYSGSGCTDTNGYGNVSPWRVPATPANSLGTVPDGKLLLWRYVSKDGHWVLVRDPAPTSGQPNWYFVHRGCVSLAPPPASPPSTPPATHCCALCNDRKDAYHADASGMSCAEAAEGFCSINDRGGVHDSFEGDCPDVPE
jgi:hypothetical protein